MDITDIIALSCVVKYYIYDIALIVFALRIIVRIRKKKPLVNWERYKQKGWNINSDRLKKMLELGYLICILLFYVGIAYEFAVATILDLPQVLTGSYYNEIGVVDGVTQRYLTIQTKDERILNIRIYGNTYKEYKEGDKVHVLYYEHIPGGFAY